MNPEKLTTVKIEVTDRLIRTGKVNNSGECPFALAVKKVVRKAVEVVAEYTRITLSDDYARIYKFQEIATPAKVFTFMEKIDARDPDNTDFDNVPKPFSINLKIKNKFLRPCLRK